jgi:hypothetical protein
MLLRTVIWPFIWTFAWTYRRAVSLDCVLNARTKKRYLDINYVSRSGLSSFVLSFYFSMVRAWVGWVVYVSLSMICYFCVWPGMVLNQRQLSIVVPDWEPYLGSLFSIVFWWVDVFCLCVSAPDRTVSVVFIVVLLCSVQFTLKKMNTALWSSPSSQNSHCRLYRTNQTFIAELGFLWVHSDEDHQR